MNPRGNPHTLAQARRRASIDKRQRALTALAALERQGKRINHAAVGRPHRLALAELTEALAADAVPEEPVRPSPVPAVVKEPVARFSDPRVARGFHHRVGGRRGDVS